jgi:hypothetical protein
MGAFNTAVGDAGKATVLLANGSGKMDSPSLPGRDYVPAGKENES